MLFASGNVIRRLTWENGAATTDKTVARALGVGAITVHPQHSNFIVAERGMGALVTIFEQEEGGAMECTPTNILDAGSIDIDCMRFSADGASLVTVSSLPDFKVSIWDWANDQENALASGTAPGEVKQCSFNPENIYQIGLLGGGNLYICNLVTGNSERLELEFLTVPPPSSDVTYVSMVWSADGRLFATTTDGCLWNIDLQQCAVAGDSTVISADAGVECHLLAGHDHLICWCSDGAVAWIGLKTMAEGHRIRVPLPQDSSLVSACLAEGRYENIFLGASLGSMYYLEVKQRMPDGSFEENEEEPSSTVLKDVDAISGEVQYCSHHSLKRITTSHGALITAVCPANSGDAIASAGQDGSIILWDTHTGTPLAVQRMGRVITCMSSMPFESLLAVGDTAGFLYLIDVHMPSRLKCKFHVRLFRESIVSISFNDDGSLLAVAAANSNQVYIISAKEKACDVVGFLEFPLAGSIVGGVRWVASRHVVVADSMGYLVACTDIPGKQEGDALKIDAVFTGMKPGGGAVRVFSNLGAQLVTATSTDRKVRSFDALQGWGRVITPEDLGKLEESQPSAEWQDHGKQVQAMGTMSPGGDFLSTCSTDGSVFLRSKDEGGGTGLGLRVNSVWAGGSSAVAVFKCSGKGPILACGGCDGSVSILTADPNLLRGGSAPPSAAQAVSHRIMDSLNEPVEPHEHEPTHAEKQQLADREMENALNAAKKNTFRDEIRKQKAALEELLSLNREAPDIERIPREQIIVDHGMREMVVADGDARVLRTKESIIKENELKDLHMSRIKNLAWDSMEVHGAELKAFHADTSVFNYPIQKTSDEEAAQLKTIHTQRRMEIACLARERKELARCNSLIYLDNHAPELDKALAEAALAEGAAADGDAGKGGGATEDESEEAWRKRQHDPCMYHRLETSTRERKTAQVIMLQQVIRKVKEEFNGKFEEYLKKKGQSLGRVEEKMSRMLEIHKELKSAEVIERPGEWYAFEACDPTELVLVVFTGLYRSWGWGWSLAVCLSHSQKS